MLSIFRCVCLDAQGVSDEQQLHAIPLLYRLATTNAATTSYQLTDRGLDPTPGVLNRLPETSIAGVTFIRDPSLPNGGVLVATQKAAREVKDLPPGTLIIGGPPAAENGDLDVQAGLDALPGAMFEGGSVGITPDWQAVSSCTVRVLLGADKRHSTPLASVISVRLASGCSASIMTSDA